jgi:hypothetical protein
MDSLKGLNKDELNLLAKIIKVKTNTRSKGFEYGLF